MIRPLPHHPYSEIFPFRDGDSLIELSDSIAELGQFDEIVLLDKQVLEGRRRQAAVIRAGKTPRYREFGSRPGDGDDPLEFAFAMNYHRRDMSEAEKVLAAVAYAGLKRGANQHTTNVGSSSASQAQAAKKFGVGVKQIERAKSVMENGTPELQEAMRAEVVSVSDAAAIADEEPAVQRKAVEQVKAGAARTLKEAVAGTKPGEDAAKIGRELSALIDRLGRVETANTAARDLACSGLRAALAIVGKL